MPNRVSIHAWSLYTVLSILLLVPLWATSDYLPLILLSTCIIPWSIIFGGCGNTRLVKPTETTSTLLYHSLMVNGCLMMPRTTTDSALTTKDNSPLPRSPIFLRVQELLRLSHLLKNLRRIAFPKCLLLDHQRCSQKRSSLSCEAFTNLRSNSRKCIPNTQSMYMNSSCNTISSTIPSKKVLKPKQILLLKLPA